MTQNPQTDPTKVQKPTLEDVAAKHGWRLSDETSELAIGKSREGRDVRIFGRSFVDGDDDSMIYPTNVRRGKTGEIESGWFVSGMSEKTDPKTGEVVDQSYFVTNYATGAFKLVKVETQEALWAEERVHAEQLRSQGAGNLVARSLVEVAPVDPFAQPVLPYENNEYPATQRVLDGRILPPSEMQNMLDSPNETSATAHALLTEWSGMELQVGLEKDGEKIAFSRVLKGRARKVAVAYVKSEGKKGVFPRLFYKSQSDGGWRATPGLYSDDGTFSKGDFKNQKGEYGQYVQATKPNEEVAAILAQLEEGEVAVEQGVVDELYKLFPLSRRISERDSALEEEERLIRVEGKGLDAFMSGAGFKYPENMEYTRWEIENQELPPGFKPDFSREPTKKYGFQHTLLGDCKIDVYSAEFQGREVDWHIARDATGRVWVDRIVSRDSKMTSYGTNSEIVVAGILSSKPIDYTKQMTGAQENVDVKKFNATYSDLSPTLNRQPWLKEYREMRGIFQK